MGNAKKIDIRPITAKVARATTRRLHYSGKVVPNSILHFGAFYNDHLEGVMQFGSPLCKNKVLPLVKDTKWNGMLELNRMAFSDKLPRNSESRALSIVIKLIKRHYPHIEWILSYADATQCGDGTIYRASGFSLTGIKKNTGMWQNKDTGEVRQDMQFHHTCTTAEKKTGQWFKLKGYMIRYIYFINPAAKERLTVAILPFSDIAKAGAKMYKGVSG